MNTITQKGEWRFPVENRFVRDTSLSIEARLLYIIIKGFAGPECEMPFPSLNTLARHLGRHRESVQKYLKELELDGHIARVKLKDRGKFVSTRYELIDHSGNLPLRKLPTTEVSSTKMYQYKEQKQGSKEEGVSSKHREGFIPRFPYPESQNEMEETLQSLGVEIEINYDGDFFDSMKKSGWKIRGNPVMDWVSTYIARAKTCRPKHRNQPC